MHAATTIATAPSTTSLRIDEPRTVREDSVGTCPANRVEHFEDRVETAIVAGYERADNFREVPQLHTPLPLHFFEQHTAGPKDPLSPTKHIPPDATQPASIAAASVEASVPASDGPLSPAHPLAVTTTRT